MTDAVVTDVACAVIWRGGRFLLQQRPEPKPWAGYWEFPGGKFEDGESGRRALARELHEELGIRVPVGAIHPWIVREHRYPEKAVQLHFFQVTDFEGAPEPREAQRLQWQSPGRVEVAPLLPANEPILRFLELPPVLGISAAARFGETEFLVRLCAALDDRGLRLIQVREKQLSGDAEVRFAQAVAREAHARGARVVLNGDPGIARAAGCDGVHLSAERLRAMGARPDLPLVGASCHDASELRRAADLGADYCLLSPVLPTKSHPGDPGMGWQGFEAIASASPIPVYALGGMTSDLAEVAQRHGAHGIALLSGIW